MFGTIIDYLTEYGDCPFSEKPMNDVDSLILCQLSYLKFDKMVPDVRENKPSIMLVELRERWDFEKLFADERFAKSNRALVQGMLSGRRFRSLRMNCYINLVKKEWETQFSAITFLLEDNTVYVAFRGTDETLVGWKEDFNMAFLTPVPGQAYSVKYLHMVAKRLYGNFYVGGHSKGGNLAVYSAMKCVPKVQERIRRVYSMDGPGFQPKVLAECNYAKIADRVVKILPHSAMIGMLFEKDIPYRVVESKYLGIAQHDPYSWLVRGDDFVKATDVHTVRKWSNSTLNEWILSLNEVQLHTFVETLYQVALASETEDLIAFTADWKKSVNGIVEALREIDEQTYRILKEMVKMLFEIAGERIREEMTPRYFKEKRPEKQLSKKRKTKEEAPPTN